MFQIPVDVKTAAPRETFEVGWIFGQTVINQIDEAVIISLQGGIAEGKSHFNHGLASAFIPNLQLSSFRNTFFHGTDGSGRAITCYDTINAKPDLDMIFEENSNPIISAEHIYTHPIVKSVHWRNRFPVKKYPPNFNVKFSTLMNWDFWNVSQNRLISVTARDRKKHEERLGAFAERVKMQLS